MRPQARFLCYNAEMMIKHCRKRTWHLWLATLLTILLPLSAAAQEYAPLPDCFSYSMDEQIRRLPEGGLDRRGYARTVNAELNERLMTMVDALADRALNTQAVATATKEAVLDTAVYAQYLGENIGSYYLYSSLIDQEQHTAMGFDALTVNVVTGETVVLPSLFASAGESALWLSGESKAQLAEAYRDEPRDEKALASILSAEHIMQLPFSLTAGSLRLHLDVAPLIPGRSGVFHVKLPFTAFENRMTREALRQIDCRSYRLASLTFDDGPHLLATQRIIRSLRNHAAMGSETILVVEDEPMILEIATTMLESLGYTVLAASGPTEAIRLAREHGGAIQLLMTDVVMPEMNGRLSRGSGVRR